MASPGQSSYIVGKAADNMLIEQLHTGFCSTFTHWLLLMRAEYPSLRVFNVHPGMAKSSVLPPQLEFYALDAREFMCLKARNAVLTCR